MVTGELGFEDLFNLGDSPSEYIPIPYYVSSFIMWIIFLVLVPIILNNMLVSVVCVSVCEFLSTIMDYYPDWGIHTCGKSWLNAWL